MKINKVTLANASTVLILEEFFDQPLLDYIKSICFAFTKDSTDWHNPEWTKLRFQYDVQSEAFVRIVDYLKSNSFNDQIKTATGKNLIFTDCALWNDQAGFGPLAPHVEAHGDFMCQIYITDNEYLGGTTIYNNDKQIVFHLPYRDNFGWFFDKCTTVMHGRAHDVPDGLNRFSLMVWYNES